jgi:predicted transcriptional regulator of viral defense system
VLHKPRLAEPQRATLVAERVDPVAERVDPVAWGILHRNVVSPDGTAWNGKSVVMKRLSDVPNWRDQFVLSRDARALGRSAELLREVRHQRLIPVVRGAYRRVDAVTEDSARAGDDAYLARIRATNLLSSNPLVFAGLSAAAVWGLPIIGSWPTLLYEASPFAAGGRSNSVISRSYIGEPVEWVERDGVRVTTLARTVVDVARTELFGRSVAMMDAAMHGQGGSRDQLVRAPVAKSQILDILHRLNRVSGSAQCRAVVAFADGASESAGESLSRVGMHLLGLPAPELQVPFSDSDGLIGIVVFWWPEYNLIGEFDGAGKYLREELRNGLSIEQVVMDEKRRENRLRALGPRVTRWDWPVARSLDLLGKQLRSAGLN